MEAIYKINKRVYGRVAAELAFALNDIKSDIFIIKEERCFNGKSMLGLLANDLSKGDIIKIKSNDIKAVKLIFNSVGDEVIE